MRALVLLAALLLPAAARAAEPPLPPGWEAVEMVYLLGTADHDARLASDSGFLIAGGDFDGDGQADRARLAVHRGAGRAALFVQLARDPSPWAHRLAEMPLPEVVQIGIVARPLGSFVTNCNAGVSDDGACGDVGQIGDHDTLTLFRFRGPARVFWWREGRFVSAWLGG